MQDFFIRDPYWAFVFGVVLGVLAVLARVL